MADKGTLNSHPCLPETPRRHLRPGIDPRQRARPREPAAQLRAWCARAGHELVAEYVEHEGGAKGERDRKAFAELLAAAARREFDLVLFWSLDRFSREGMAQTVGYLQRLQANGVDFHSYTEEYLATDNELVRNILLAVMASLAKVEAQRISERTKAGLARARAHGKKLGRPALPDTKRAKIERSASGRPQALDPLDREGCRRRVRNSPSAPSHAHRTRITGAPHHSAPLHTGDHGFLNSNKEIVCDIWANNIDRTNILICTVSTRRANRGKCAVS